MEYKGTKYPKECYSTVRKQTFAVTPELSLATAAEGYSPLKIYNSFSRFSVTIINEARRAATANIPVQFFESILRKSQAALLLDMQSHVMPTARTEIRTPAASGTSPAYTVRIASGMLRGRTPADILSDSSIDGSKLLQNQEKWLKANLTSYPANQKQIDAIDDAFGLQMAGLLTASAQTAADVSAPASQIVLYHAPYRALIRKKREDGKCPVYDIKIIWNLGREYPVEVRILNYYAPVVRDQRGMIKVQAQQACDKLDCTMQLLEDEWNDALRAMKASMRQFEILHARDCILDAANADMYNRDHSAAQTDPTRKAQ